MHTPFKTDASKTGLTLVELLVVLVILIGVAGLLTPQLTNLKVRSADGSRIEPGEVVTRETMRRIQEALMGNAQDDLGYRGHVGNLPSRLSGLFEDVDSEGPYNPATKRGWNGPYIVDTGARYETYTTTGDNFLTLPGDANGYAEDEDPVALDGWGKPIILQRVGTDFVRLVSAGPDRILQTDPDEDTPSLSDRGDDIVQFLEITDPL